MPLVRLLILPPLLFFLARPVIAQNDDPLKKEVPAKKAVAAKKKAVGRIALPAVVAPAQIALPVQPGNPAQPAIVGQDDEKTLRDLRLSVDAPALLEYFRSRTHAEANPRQMNELIQQLGSNHFHVREKAYTTILGLSSGAMVALKAAESTSDTETLRRVLDLRRRIEEKANPAIQAATARLLAKLKPKGTVEVLLNYLPFAADNSVIDEIATTLTVMNRAEGQPHPALVAALKDKLAIKRGVAAEALAGLAPVRDQVVPLLKDIEARVRLRTALALATAHHRDAVPTLIEVLGELPADELWPAEEILVRLAGEKCPTVSLGVDDPGRKECRRAWSEWWEKNGKDINLARLSEEPQLLGYTVLVQQTFNKIVNGRVVRGAGEIVELDKNKTVRFKVAVENTYPVDAQVIGNERVLVTEFNGRRISERDGKGNIVWEFGTPNNPISAQRLPSGHTFIVMQNQLLEIDRNKTQVLTVNRNNYDIFRARKLRTGEVAIITNQGNYVRLDPKTQKEVANFYVGQLGNLFGNFEVLVNGNVLVPLYQQQCVVEYNPQGKEVWRHNTPWPSSAQRLPNGNTLIASMNSRRVIEVNRQGQEIWAHNVEGQVFNARRR